MASASSGPSNGGKLPKVPSKLRFFVKNTFVNVVETVTLRASRRSKSIPKEFSFSRSKSQEGDESSEARRRSQSDECSDCCEKAEDHDDDDTTDVASLASTRNPGSTLCGSTVGGSAPGNSGVSYSSVPHNNVETVGEDSERPFGALSSSSFATSSWACQPADVNEQEDSPYEECVEKTTLMFRNLPEGFSRRQLEELLDAQGFAKRYDFIYLPAELATMACFGYAFINMVAPDDAEAFVQHFQGFDEWPVPCRKRAVVHMSEALQGMQTQIERYRNSPLMHPVVPDDLRPAVYSDGVRIPFPEPTAPLKPPRVRASARRKVPGWLVGAEKPEDGMGEMNSAPENSTCEDEAGRQAR